MDSAANKTAIREGRGLAALVNLLRRQRAASPLAASSLRNYEGEALRERAAQGLDALCQGDAKNQEAVVLAGGAEPLSDCCATAVLRDGARHVPPRERRQPVCARHLP